MVTPLISFVTEDTKLPTHIRAKQAGRSTSTAAPRRPLIVGLRTPQSAATSSTAAAARPSAGGSLVNAAGRYGTAFSRGALGERLRAFAGRSASAHGPAPM